MAYADYYYPDGSPVDPLTTASEYVTMLVGYNECGDTRPGFGENECRCPSRDINGVYDDWRNAADYEGTMWANALLEANRYRRFLND